MTNASANRAMDSAYNLLYDMTDSIPTEYLKDFKWRNKTK